MSGRLLLALTVLSIASTAPARADKRALDDSRHPTAMERRRERAKVVEDMEKDGFKPLPHTPKIIGGHAASEGEYPWMVALVTAGEESNYDGLYCGGSLIHPRWVLTAAHCVIGSRPEDIEIVVGATDLENSPSAQRIAVSEIVISPNYNDYNLDSDFALLRLAEPANAALGPIPLIDDSALANPGVQAIITGWGDTTNGEGEYPAHLQEVEVPIVDLAVANASDAYLGTLTENMLAAGLAAGGKDSCSGDSGGPLLVPSPIAPGFMQAGIVSFGDECAVAGVYGIYTRVGNFRSFITGHLRPNYAQWELANGRSGEARDPDGNGFTNFEDFALPDHVLPQIVASGMAHLSYRRPAVAPEASYILERAPNPAGPWEAVTGTTVSVTPGGDGLARWDVDVPDPVVAHVYRIRAEISREVANGLRPFDFPGHAIGTLDSVDSPHPTLANRFTKSYILNDLPTGGSLSVTLRSGEFDTVLELLNADTGGVLQTAEGNLAKGPLGTDELLQFTPQADTDYVLRVTTAAESATGDYELSIWDPATRTSLPDLVVQASQKPKVKPLKASLTAADPFDPFFEPGGSYYKDDYQLDTSAVPTESIVEIAMKSKGSAATGIDDFVGLIDGESGKLITGNDNLAGKSNDAALRFMPVPGKSYTVRCSSSVPRDVGSYTLSAIVPKLTVKTPLALIGASQSVTGKLAAASELDDHYFTAKRDYLLQGETTGQAVVVTLASAKFDAYLIILDAADLSVVIEGDTGGPAGGVNNALASFVPEAGHRYIIRATTYDERESGAYVLSTASH